MISKKASTTKYEEEKESYTAVPNDIKPIREHEDGARINTPCDNSTVLQHAEDTYCGCTSGLACAEVETPAANMLPVIIGGSPLAITDLNTPLSFKNQFVLMPRGNAQP